MTKKPKTRTFTEEEFVRIVRESALIGIWKFEHDHGKSDLLFRRSVIKALGILTLSEHIGDFTPQQAECYSDLGLLERTK